MKHFQSFIEPAASLQEKGADQLPNHAKAPLEELTLSLAPPKLTAINPPERIYLEAQVIPSWITNDLTVSATMQEKELGTLPFVKTHGMQTNPLSQQDILEKVVLQYTGQGHYYDGFEQMRHPFYGYTLANWHLLFVETLYTRAFVMPSQKHYHVAASLAYEKFHVKPPGEVNVWPYFPLGGFYKPQCSLLQIQPLFFTIVKFQDSPNIQIESVEDFQQKNICPPQRGTHENMTMTFLEVPPDMNTNHLADDLLKQQATFSLMSLNGLKQQYHSTGFRYIHNIQASIEIEYSRVA